MPVAKESGHATPSRGWSRRSGRRRSGRAGAGRAGWFPGCAARLVGQQRGRRGCRSGAGRPHPPRPLPSASPGSTWCRRRRRVVVVRFRAAAMPRLNCVWPAFGSCASCWSGVASVVIPGSPPTALTQMRRARLSVADESAEGCVTQVKQRAIDGVEGDEVCGACLRRRCRGRPRSERRGSTLTARRAPGRSRRRGRREFFGRGFGRRFGGCFGRTFRHLRAPQVSEEPGGQVRAVGAGGGRPPPAGSDDTSYESLARSRETLNN